MKWSKMLIPTVKEVPADAEVPSHQLMIRGGFIRKLASGTYSYLPLGWRTLNKIMGIVRAEMDAAGAQEMLLPAVQPIDLWQRTGRDVDYGETMCRFTDRHGRENVLAPTAEEVITYVAGCEINSYKQLPLNLYQMSFKFRDEFRPRFGVLRSREFIMKDSYSFHASPESLEETYRIMYDTYKRIFERCGVEYVIVEAETGEMGGSGSHQFTVPCETGEDVIVYTADGSYAANIEKADVDGPKDSGGQSAAGAMAEVHTPQVGSIEAVCGFLKTKPEEMIKTLIYRTSAENAAKQVSQEKAKHDGRLVITSNAYVENYYIALVRGDHDVNEEKLRIATGESVCLADEKDIIELTGAAVGFAGPMQMTDHPYVVKLIVDPWVAALPVGVTGANKTDYHVKNVVPGRDFALEGEKVIIRDIRNAVEGDTYKGQPLLFRRGIEVGQVFKLGTKYSAKLEATYLDENGKSQPCIMGCYGIGINRIMASAIEVGNDENGVIWPISIAPYEVLITVANANDDEVTSAAEKIYQQLLDDDIDVLLDDRSIRGGVKFKDADLVGIPVRITVGSRGVAEGQVEIKLRREAEKELVAIDEAAGRAERIVAELYAELEK